MLNRKRIRKKIILTLICLFILFFIIPTIVLNKKLTERKELTLYDKFLQQQLTEEKKIYNVIDLVQYMRAESLSDKYGINLVENNIVIFENHISITIILEDFSADNSYYCNIKKDSDEQNIEIENNEQTINIDLIEGKNEIEVILYENKEQIKTQSFIIYYVEPYKEQFLDELSKNGVAAHYEQNEDYNKSGPLLKALGAKYIRTDFFKYIINPIGDDYNYENYDHWMNDLYNNTEIKVLAIIDGLDTVNSEERLNTFVKFFKNVENKYPQIEDFEIINEPNFEYRTEDSIGWYSNLIKNIENVSDKNIVIGGLALSSTSLPCFDPYEYYRYFCMNGGGIYNNSINFHSYVSSRIDEAMTNYRTISKNFGGFNRIYVTEYGNSSAGTSEHSQAKRSSQTYSYV